MFHTCNLPKESCKRFLIFEVDDISLYPVFLFTKEKIVNSLYVANPPAYFFKFQQRFPLNVCWNDDNEPEVWQSEVVVPGVQYRHAQHHGVPRLRLAGHHAPDGLRAGGRRTGPPGGDFSDQHLRGMEASMEVEKHFWSINWIKKFIRRTNLFSPM